MKDSIRAKLEGLEQRFEEVSGLMSDPDVQADQNRFRDLSREYAQIEPVIETYRRYLEAEEAVEEAQILLEDDDPEMRALAEDDLSTNQDTIKDLDQELQILLLPSDPNDHHNVFLEIRAGTGGDEAAIFAGDLHRMYTRYAENLGWRMEVLSASDGDHGGYKEIITRVSGADVYANLKFESGAHRVQRVPETESQGRIHTSACTVAIIPEADEVGEIDINPADLRIDTFRASGAGGQHVNKTDSAIRITHVPTGTVVECQEERSQHKNKAKAMALLSSRLLDAERQKAEAEAAENRRNLVGSGDRSERIRTYNYPQGRLTDHRINLTLYKLEAIMEGDMAQVIDPLVQEHQMDLLAQLGE